MILISEHEQWALYFKNIHELLVGENIAMHISCKLSYGRIFAVPFSCSSCGKFYFQTSPISMELVYFSLEQRNHFFLSQEMYGIGDWLFSRFLWKFLSRTPGIRVGLIFVGIFLISLSCVSVMLVWLLSISDKILWKQGLNWTFKTSIAK